VKVLVLRDRQRTYMATAMPRVASRRAIRITTNPSVERFGLQEVSVRQ
jgi:hypothetical protein